jgi:hypothetical protein
LFLLRQGDFGQKTRKCGFFDEKIYLLQAHFDFRAVVSSWGRVFEQK